MIRTGETKCPKCGGQLRYYDSVKRIRKSRYGKTEILQIRRLKCTKCGSVHRELPESLLPYKQYEAEIIFGVLEGIITNETLGFEDYPCELTMKRWRTQKMQVVL